MPPEIGNACLPHERAETAAKPFIRLTGLWIKEQIFRLFFFGFGDKTGDDFVSNFIQRNSAGFSNFRFSENDGPFLEINLLDLQVESLATAHPGVPCQNDE